MKLRILRRNDQVDGQFNGGAILEKRPIVYQEDKTFPYSNIFYWAHAWSEKGSTIGLHPHQGFEILSFILKGSIEHYDTKNKSWMPLEAGDVQIIRSGKGISHAEKVNADSAIFQIWFDPDLHKSLSQPATYDDYKSAAFPVVQNNGISTKILKGENSPLQMTTEGVSIKQLTIKKGAHELPLSTDSIYSCFLLNGLLKVNSEPINAEDFFAVGESEQLKFEALSDSILFAIESPAKPSYQTYAEMHS